MKFNYRKLFKAMGIASIVFLVMIGIITIVDFVAKTFGVVGIMIALFIVIFAWLSYIIYTVLD